MEYRLYDIRETIDLKQWEVADKIGMSRGNYANKESEIANITLKDFNNYCNVFEYSMDYVARLTAIPTYRNIKYITFIDKTIIKERLSTIEKEQNISAKAIAKLLGVAECTYSEYKNPNSNNMIQTLFLKKICLTFNYSMDWVVGRTENKSIKTHSK